MKIGAITIGQAPRVDVTADIMDIFGGNIELFQRGGLDGLTREEIETFKPEEGDYVLVSRLTDGSSVTFAERYILGICRRESTLWKRKGYALSWSSAQGNFRKA